jgi:hypothetical protein
MENRSGSDTASIFLPDGRRWASRMQRHFITMFGERSPRRPRDHAFVIAHLAYLLISGQATALCGAASPTKPRRRWRGIVAELRVDYGITPQRFEIALGMGPVARRSVLPGINRARNSAKPITAQAYPDRDRERGRHVREDHVVRGAFRKSRPRSDRNIRSTLSSAARA